jgi:hypothetical protein
MSYDIHLLDPVSKEVIEINEPHFMRGATYAVDGSTQLTTNITYNYAIHFITTLGPKGIRTIYGLSGADSIPVLQAAVDQLGDDVDADYWEPTEGNAKRALLQLIALAKLRPDGIWSGD